MSRVVKDLVAQDIARRLDGVEDCVLANVIGMDAQATSAMRKKFREKEISVLVIKNSLARRATEGTSLAPAFEGLDGTNAIFWGGEDFVSLVKEVVELDKDESLEAFEARGGAMDGESLTPDKVREISKWPNRNEQLSMLVGQIMGPGAQLAAQLKGPGGKLAGQIKEVSEKGE